MPDRRLVPLTVRNPWPVLRQEDVMICGVPLRRGQAADPSHLALVDEAGTSVRCQAEALARWVDGSLKWVLLTIPNVSLKPKGRKRFLLWAADKPRRRQGIRLRQTQAGLRVDTGRLRFTVCRRGPLVSRIESSHDGSEVRFERQRARFAPDFRYAELYQDSATHWRLRRWVDRSRREVFCAEGLRADGWVELAGAGGRVAVAVREFWQNHPKSLAADADTGQLCIGLYPEQSEPLNLTRYSALAYPWTYEHPSFRCREPVVADPSEGAHGIRKTHDCALFFDEPNPSARAFCLNHPLLLEWAPSHTARTGVVVPATTRMDRQWMRRFNEFVDFLGEEMLGSGGTGYLDYFDLPHGFNVAEGRWHHDFGGWGYDNDEAMPCLGLWQTYLLTRRHDVFAMARAMTRHNGDIDSYIIGKRAGYGTRHNVNHWGDTCKERRVSQPIGKRFLYYLTGDRSVLDLAQVVFESFCRQAVEPRRFNMTCDVPALVATLILLEETELEAGEA